MADKRGWFAEQLEPGDYHYTPETPWVATLQCNGYVATFDGPWFQTQEDCEQFLHEEVIGKGMWPSGQVSE